FTSTKSRAPSPRALTPFCCSTGPDGTPRASSTCPKTSRRSSCLPVRPNSTRSRMSGNIFARTGSQTPCSKTMTRSSTPPAQRGESSSLNPKRSPPSECATGRTSVSRYDPWYNTLPRGIFHSELWGKRLHKYRNAAENTLKGVKWSAAEPRSPFYLFVPQARDLWAEYLTGFALPEIFVTNVLGFQTHRDGLAISFQQSRIKNIVRDFKDRSKSDRQIRETYSVEDGADWSVAWARNRLENVDTSG